MIWPLYFSLDLRPDFAPLTMTTVIMVETPTVIASKLDAAINDPKRKDISDCSFSDFIDLCPSKLREGEVMEGWSGRDRFNFSSNKSFISHGTIAHYPGELLCDRPHSFLPSNMGAFSF